MYVQEHGHTVVYQKVTISTWYCAWCHDGPMSLDINTNCEGCGYYRDQHDITESRQEYRRVTPRRSHRPPMVVPAPQGEERRRINHAIEEPEPLGDEYMVYEQQSTSPNNTTLETTTTEVGTIGSVLDLDEVRDSEAVVTGNAPDPPPEAHSRDASGAKEIDQRSDFPNDTALETTSIEVPNVGWTVDVDEVRDSHPVFTGDGDGDRRRPPSRERSRGPSPWLDSKAASMKPKRSIDGHKSIMCALPIEPQVDRQEGDYEEAGDALPSPISSSVLDDEDFSSDLMSLFSVSEMPTLTSRTTLSSFGSPFEVNKELVQLLLRDKRSCSQPVSRS